MLPVRENGFATHILLVMKYKDDSLAVKGALAVHLLSVWDRLR